MFSHRNMYLIQTAGHLACLQSPLQTSSTHAHVLLNGRGRWTVSLHLWNEVLSGGKPSVSSNFLSWAMRFAVLLTYGLFSIFLQQRLLSIAKAHLFKILLFHSRAPSLVLYQCFEQECYIFCLYVDVWQKKSDGKNSWESMNSYDSEYVQYSVNSIVSVQVKQWKIDFSSPKKY